MIHWTVIAHRRQHFGGSPGASHFTASTAEPALAVRSSGSYTPSDFYPVLLHFPTDQLTGFHLSATIAFNCPEVRNLGRSDMAAIAETPIKRTIRRSQLREMVPLADSTIYELEQRGEFPRRFALSPRCVVWDLAEVEAWLTSRRSVPIPRAKHPDVQQRHARPVKAPDRAQRLASKSG
jgi:prophage regulatory protein